MIKFTHARAVTLKVLLANSMSVLGMDLLEAI